MIEPIRQEYKNDLFFVVDVISGELSIDVTYYYKGGLSTEHEEITLSIEEVEEILQRMKKELPNANIN